MRIFLYSQISAYIAYKNQNNKEYLQINQIPYGMKTHAVDATQCVRHKQTILASHTNEVCQSRYTAVCLYLRYLRSYVWQIFANDVQIRSYICIYVQIFANKANKIKNTIQAKPARIFGLLSGRRASRPGCPDFAIFSRICPDFRQIFHNFS